MHIGSIIRYYRTKLGIKQYELADDVCSPAHLCKIENNPNEGNDETINLLLDKLGIDLEKELQKEIDLKYTYEEFANNIRFVNINQSQRQYNTLRNNQVFIELMDFHNHYQIMLIPFYIISEQFESLEDQYNLCNKISKSFNKDESILFEIVKAFYYIYKLNYSKAKAILLDMLKNANATNVSYRGDIDYALALCYYNLNEYEKALNSTIFAYRYYQNEDNFQQVGHCLAILADSYKNLNLNEEAEATYKKLIRTSEMLGNHKLLNKGLYEYGLLQTNKVILEETLTLFDLPLEQNSGDISTQLESILSKIDLMMKSNIHKDKIQKYIQYIKNLSLQIEDKTYYFLSLYYEYKIEKPSQVNDFLEKKLIPFLEKSDCSSKLIVYYKELADYYESIDLKKSLYYLKKCMHKNEYTNLAHII
ncbi:helix-turn-helix domain-containing protein [Priestia megaterium]|uniref:helix-turn-helix domain-containing protein n=4 Tax=Priestia megaterium TaxID=1404 RepID=UPI000CA379D0|nr:helix-turn-helix transcriptional regulator [Priestia megaterium]AUO14644.1 XRE family transcriptional regulator [Priestia megaterium]